MLYAAAITLAAAAVATDLRSRRILNWLTLPALGAGVTIGLVNGGFGGLATSLVGILVGGGLLLGPTLIGAMGAGDLKFQSAMGALLGPWFAAIAWVRGLGDDPATGAGARSRGDNPVAGPAQRGMTASVDVEEGTGCLETAEQDE
ncbi:MAG: A24 family peptidase [Chloroflexota bacterium]|nr:A24 family peptidase [Chloroflexota bacterium]